MQEYIERPFLQIVFFILLSLVVMPIARPKDASSVWNIAGAMYAAFIVVNSILTIFVPQVWSYFFYSMLCTLVYLFVTAITIPAYIKIAKAEGSNESAMVFIIAMYHPLASLLVIALQWTYQKVTA